MEKIEKDFLISLAEKYEVPSFCEKDPCQFLRWYPETNVADVECAAFIAAMLAFGNRKQFLPKISQILELADKTSNSVSQWLLKGAPDFPKGEKKFYRFYSYNDMHSLFSQMAQILEKDKTLGNFFFNEWTNLSKNVSLDEIIGQSFPFAKIVPKGKSSANKRIHMFLRWMVRQNSPVDLGLWNWYPQSELLIPMDVHVMQEGIRLGLLPENVTATKKTARMLTQKMNKVFPGDPARADYALFGLGVDEEKY